MFSGSSEAGRAYFSFLFEHIHTWRQAEEGKRREEQEERLWRRLFLLEKEVVGTGERQNPCPPSSTPKSTYPLPNLGKVLPSSSNPKNAKSKQSKGKRKRQKGKGKRK